MTSFFGMSFFILGGDFMHLETKRLIIRDFNINDLDAYYKLKSNHELAYFAGYKPYPDLKTAKYRLQNILMLHDYYAICLKSTGELIGDLNFYNDPIRKAPDAFQLGFTLNIPFWHKGFMSEALRGFIPYLFKHHTIDILTCATMTENLASRHVIEALNFNFDGIIRHYKRLYTGDMVDCMIYTLTKTEFERNDINEKFKS